jgi:predicted MFS family arabinose efflux permease
MQSTAAVRPSEKVLPYAWVILAVVYFASVVAPFNQFKIPPIMPVLMSAFQLNLTQAGALMSILAVIGLVLALPAGIILQRLGSKVTILIALSFMAAGAALGALAQSYGLLMFSRVIEGAGMGLIGVAAPATIAMWFPPSQRGTPMGIWATWVPVGSVAIYNLSPQLASTLGWAAVWWLGVGFALIMIIFSGLLLRLPPALPQQSASGPQKLALREALANRNIWLLSVQFACFNLALVALATYYPTFLAEVRGYPLGQAAFLASLGTMVVLFSAPLAGWLSDRIGSRSLFITFPYLLVAVFFIFPFHVTGWQIPVIMIIQGFILGAIPTATFAAAPEIMRKPEWAGLGLAVVLVGQNLGQLIGPVLFGQMVYSLGWAVAGYLLIPVCLLGFVSARMVKVR